MPSLVTALFAVAAGVLYAVGVRRMRRAWPAWRTTLFFLGLAALVAAVAPPIDTQAAIFFAWHMVQHMLLTVVAPPLLMLGAPLRPLLRALPLSVRARVIRPLARSSAIRSVVHVARHPLIAAALYVGGLYAWHLPDLYDAALLDARVHVVEHAWFFTSALIFWSVVIDPLPFRGTLAYGARLPYLLVLGAAQNTVLGGILSFSSRLLYPSYERIPVFDLDRVSDQRIGGAIMWVVGDFVFLAAASAAFFLWLAEEEEMQRRRERVSDSPRRL